MNRTHFSFNKPEEESSDTLSTHLPCSSYNSLGTVSPPLTGSPAHDSDSVSDNSKKIRKKRNTYQKIDDTTRMKLLDAVQQGETLKAAAKRYGINYSSAKSILHTYRKEGRILKKSAQERIARKRTKTSSDIEMSPIYPYKQFQGFGEGAENQVYGSVDFQQKIDLPIMTGLGDDGQVRQTAANGMTINSFGDFLKVDSQGRTKSENSNLTSSIMLKLDSQRYQAVQTNNINNMPAHNSVPVLNPAPIAPQNSRNIQSGNWQLNVNVRSENPQAPMVRTLNFKDEPRFTYNFTTRAPENSRPQEPCYVDFSNNTQPTQQPRNRREVPVEYDQRFMNKRYDTDMAYGNQEQYRPVEEQQHQQHHQQQQQNYDVSYFLNSSSPAYGFQPRTNEVEQMGNVQEFPSDYYQGNREQPDQMYGRMKKGPYMNTFSVNFEQGAPGMLKTASLRSY